VSLRRPIHVRPWREWTLRSRLVVSVTALVLVGLVIADVSGVLLLRSYLVERVDQQLSAGVRRIPRGGLPVDTNAWRMPQFGPSTTTLYFTNDGRLEVGPGALGGQPDLGSFTDLRAHAGAGPFTVDSTSSGQWRVEVVALDDNAGYAVAGVSLAEVNQTQERLLLINGVVTILVLGGIGVAAATVVRLGLRPLTRMESAAAEIAGGDLTRRVEDADPHTEQGRLGTALNLMLVHIETAMAERTASEQRLRQFLADAAHELRTPLTSIQGFAELYRRGGVQAGAELGEAMGAIESEVGRMRLLVNDLLLLARLDEERELARRPVDLLEVAADAVRDAHVRVPSRFVLLGPLHDGEETFDPVTVDGDEARLRQVTTNLVANALQHTPDDAEVIVRVGRARAGDPPVNTDGPDTPAAVVGTELPAAEPVAVIEVADTGPGLRRSDAARVFERLYRAENSRSRRHGGAGLGLSIVASIVQAHGGRCELWTEPGVGARFRVLLPTANNSSPAQFRTGQGDQVLDAGHPVGITDVALRHHADREVRRGTGDAADRVDDPGPGVIGQPAVLDRDRFRPGVEHADAPQLVGRDRREQRDRVLVPGREWAIGFGEGVEQRHPVDHGGCGEAPLTVGAG
jgi:two-component system OmpR family sensor kinase